MACGMSDYDWAMWENGQYHSVSTPEITDPVLLRAQYILSGNEGWFTREEIEWALKQYPD